MLELAVNGVRHTLDVNPETRLLHGLRNELGLTGAKLGCGLAQWVTDGPGAMHVIEDAQAMPKRLDLVGILLEPRAGH